jgi:hypothetical protein
MLGWAGAGLGGFGTLFGGGRGLARAREGPGWCGARWVQGRAGAGPGTGGQGLAGARPRLGAGPGGSRGGAGTARSNFSVLQPKQAKTKL